MKTSFIAVVIFSACIPFATSQQGSLRGLPGCALPCGTQAITATGCSALLLDGACVCKDKAFVESIKICVSQRCSECLYQARALALAASYCGAFGVTLDASELSCDANEPSTGGNVNETPGNAPSTATTASTSATSGVTGVPSSAIESGRFIEPTGSIASGSHASISEGSSSSSESHSPTGTTAFSTPAMKDNGKRGLSPELKIGIGVGVPMGVIIIALIAFVAYLYAKKHNSYQEELVHRQDELVHRPPDVLSPPIAPELHASEKEIYEAPGRPDKPRSLQEMEVKTSQPPPVMYELPGYNV